MPSSKEVLQDWLAEGYTVPQEQIDYLYNNQALTEELAEKRFQEKYGKYLPWSKAEQIEDPIIPTLDIILDYIPKKDGDNRSKYEIFLQDFPKKSAEWKKKFTKDPTWGERGWNTVYDVWKKVSNWKMQDNIRQARKDAVNEVDKPWYHPSRLYGMYASLMLPRAWEHLENEGDFTGKDIAADMAVNSAMAIPGAAFTGLGAKALTKVAPKVAPKVLGWFAHPGRNLVEGALKGAGRMAGNIAGNAVVPFASEGLDAAIYDENDTGMEHRADFSIGDAVLGTAINQGVNRGLMRMAGPMIDRFSAGGMARGGVAKARAVLERLGQSFKQSGDDYANKVAARVSTPVVAEPGEVTEEGLKSIIYGGMDLSPEGQIMEAYKKALREQEVLEGIRNGQIKLNTEEAKKKAEKLAKEKYKAAFDEVMNTIKDVHGKYPPKSEVLHDGSVNVEFTHPKEEAQRIMEALAMAKKFETAGKGTPVKYFFDTPEEGIMNEYANNSVAVTRPTIDEVIEKNPAEILNYAAWHGQSAPGQGLVGRKERALDILNQAFPAWGINKWGSETDANLILGPMPTVKKALDENRKKTAQAPKDRQASADVLKVIGNGGLTQDDVKYLDAIAKNPEIMRIGYKDDPTGFKMWLLERGNDLLAGTRAARPTFGVE